MHDDTSDLSERDPSLTGGGLDSEIQKAKLGGGGSAVRVF